MSSQIKTIREQYKLTHIEYILMRIADFIDSAEPSDMVRRYVNLFLHFACYLDVVITYVSVRPNIILIGQFLRDICVKASLWSEKVGQDCALQVYSYCIVIKALIANSNIIM